MPVGTYAHKDGTSWWFARVNHKYERDYKQGFESEEEAWEWYFKRLREMKAGDPRSKEGKEITMAEMAEQWVDFKRPRVKYSTLRDYQNQLDLRILPKFGKRKINSITPIEIQKYLDSLDSSRIANKTRFVFGAIYRLAIRYGLAQMDPTRAVAGFKIEKKEARVLTMDELRSILYYLEEKWATQIILTVATGMRIGEVNALTWGDVSPSFINVDKSFRQGRLDSPKTFKSKRHVTISPAIWEMLKRHKEAQGSPPDNALVFSKGDGRHLESWNVYTQLNRAAKEAKVGKTRVHDLRHTYTTWMVEGEQGLKLIQDQLGHADISTTMDIYTHVMKGAREEYRKWFDTHIAPNLLRGILSDDLLPEEEQGKIVPLHKKKR